MGDGVLVYFGYPQAHEDDAERAVRAGLELVAAVGQLKTYAPLQTRIGIATGLVVVGDLIGSGASQEQAIVGDTPNLAAEPPFPTTFSCSANGSTTMAPATCSGAAAQTADLERCGLFPVGSVAHQGYGKGNSVKLV